MRTSGALARTWVWVGRALFAVVAVYLIARYRVQPPATDDPPLVRSDSPSSGLAGEGAAARGGPSAPADGTLERAWPWLGLSLYVVAVALYLLARYHGNWAEADSSTFTRHIRGFVDAATLVPPGEVYPNGYVDQALSAVVIAFTGLDVSTLQQYIYPLAAAIIVPPAWMTYRALTGTALGAAFSTMILFTLPDFLFVILRSSHEKFSRTLLLACLFLLVVLVQRRPGVSRIALAGLFWFASYALIATNLLIASSFILALATAAGLGFALSWVRPALARSQRAFGVPALILAAGAIGLVYVFVFHAYPPAGHNIAVMQDTWDQVIALFTGPADEAVVLGAYDYIASGWVDPRVYLVLSLSNWLILIVSLALWGRQGWRWVVRSQVPRQPAAWIVWLLYAAFVLQGALAFLSDASGAFGSNLQVRLFPSFTMVAAAVIGTSLAARLPTVRHRAVPWAVASAAVTLSLLAVVKATNEPLLSNKWSFYRPGEIVGLRWQDERLTEADVWSEFDERLISALHMEVPAIRNRYTGTVRPSTRDMAVSEVTRLRSIRLGQPLPVPPDAWRIYDNGVMQLYHLRPETPYQR